MKFRSLSVITLLVACALPSYAEDTEYSEGFLTHYLNRSISNSMKDVNAADSAGIPYSRRLTQYVTPPVFGGYIVGKYGYTDRQDAKVSNTFEGRLIRAYVSGTLLRDFKYRIQVELKNTPAMRDYTLEWVHWKEFQVKAGQFKRCFTFENPANPWDIGFGGYSQVVQRMCAFGAEDPSGEASQNGRDVGLQLQGDLLPVGSDHHRLFHYQAAVYNGSGQNKTDNNNKKDWMGTFQVQPVQDLYIALFGWRGSYRQNDVEVGRNRWALSARYEHGEWSARAEYAHHSGHHLSDYDAKTDTWKGRGRSDGWYATVGVPCTPWLKTYVKYDAYRSDATWNTTRSVYSVCPNFQLHKNLKFQLQYNFVCDKTNKADHHYHEFWAQSYVRF